jgi:hypothetical protein
MKFEEEICEEALVLKSKIFIAQAALILRQTLPVPKVLYTESQSNVARPPIGKHDVSCRCDQAHPEGEV